MRSDVSVGRPRWRPFFWFMVAARAYGRADCPIAAVYHDDRIMKGQNASMSNTVLLDNVAHHDLKVITGHSAAFGDNEIVNYPVKMTQNVILVAVGFAIWWKLEMSGDQKPRNETTAGT